MYQTYCKILIRNHFINWNFILLVNRKIFFKENCSIKNITNMSFGCIFKTEIYVCGMSIIKIVYIIYIYTYMNVYINNNNYYKFTYIIIYVFKQDFK